MTAIADRTPRRGAWIPWIFVGGMLLVVAVNGVMIRLAIGTFSGVTVERPYERGIAYNEIIAAQKRQDLLGWTAEATLRPVADGTEVRLRLAGRDGEPLGEVALAAHIERPLEPASRIELEFRREGRGVHVARPVGLRPGQWDLTIDARRPEGRLHLRNRMTVP